MTTIYQIAFRTKCAWRKRCRRTVLSRGVAAELTTVGGTGKIITLKLANPSTAKTLTYIKGGKWKQDDAIIRGSNNIAALTFCEVPIRPVESHYD